MEITPETIAALLNEFCDHGAEITPDTELLESGLLDSLAFIELLNALEDMGCQLSPARTPRESFATARSIAGLAVSSLKA